MTVFARSMEYLKDEALKVICQRTGDEYYNVSDIQWVITVPACRSCTVHERSCLWGKGLAFTESSFCFLQYGSAQYVFFREARNSFFDLGVYLLKSKFRIEDKLRFPWYYTNFSTNDQRLISHWFPSNSYHHSNGNGQPSF